MAAKRRKIVEEDLERGYGATTIPTDSGGIRAASKFGIHTILGGAYISAADVPGDNAGQRISAALDAMPSTGGIVDARALYGAQTISSALTIPSKVTLLLGSATFTQSATITVTLGAAGTSGKIIGSGPDTILSYTGSGHAVELSGSGTSSSQVEVSDLSIAGTSSGLSGLHLKAFNLGLFRNLQISGFTASATSGVLNEGANTITFRDCNIRGNWHGIRNVGVVVSATNYAANAVLFDGGHIINNVGWGVFEDGSQSATVGPNYNNIYRSTIEFNGVNGSSTTGNVFVQQGNAIKFTDCYFEYGGGIVPTVNILIGDGTYAPTGTIVRNNVFLSGGATSTISNVNGASTMVFGNLETGSVTNFVLNGSASRGLTQFRNRAAAATNLFAGSDGGADSWIMETTAVTGTNFNAMAATTTGVAFNNIRGFNQDLVIRARSGGTNIVTFDASDGTDRLIISDAGVVTIGGGVTIQSGSGTPEGAITAVVGSLYMRTNGGAGTSLYVKESGSGNTGWIGK